MRYSDIDEARIAHFRCGGFLYDLGGSYFVTEEHPSEHRSFDTTRDAIDYAFRLAEAGYDETKMKVPA